jgi:hypothetical protein
MTKDTAGAAQLVCGVIRAGPHRGIRAGLRAVAVPALAAAALLAACGDGSRPSRLDLVTSAERVGQAVEHSLTVDGVRRAVLRADTAWITPAAPLVQLRRVNVEVFADNGVIVATLAGDSGEYDQAARQLSIRGGVTLIIRSPMPQTVHTEELHYHATTGQVVSDAFNGTLARSAPSRGQD